MSKKQGNRVQKCFQFFKGLGPGLITGASDDDPSGIATYSQAGAQFGLATLWTALITPVAIITEQDVAARASGLRQVLGANLKSMPANVPLEIGKA